MNKIVKYALMSLAVAMAFVAMDAAAAAGGNVFNTILDRMLRTFRNSRSVIFVVGGFGLIGLGFAAIFGKVNWKWLAALACGLAIVAVAGQVVDYVTREQVAQNVTDQGGVDFIDTLDTDAGAYGTGSSGLGL